MSGQATAQSAQYQYSDPMTAPPESLNAQMDEVEAKSVVQNIMHPSDPQAEDPQDLNKQMDQVAEQATANPDQPPPTYQASLQAWAAPRLQYLKDQWEDGNVQVPRGQGGWSAITGDRTYEQAENEFNTEHLKQLKARIGNTDSTLKGIDLVKLTGYAINGVPFMGETIKGGLKGGAGGAAIGGAGGATLGLLGGPASEVTVPGGAATGAIGGFTWGSRAGSFYTAAKIMSGNMYLDLREKGIKDDTAKVVAVSSGVVIGAISALNLGQLTALGKQAAVKELQSAAGKQAMTVFFKQYLKQAGITWTELQIQNGVNIAGNVIAAQVDKNPNAMPSNDQIRKQILDSATNSLGFSALAPAAAHVTGSALGAAGKGVRELSDIAKSAEIKDAQNASILAESGAQNVMSGKLTPTQAFKLIEEGFKNEKKPTQEEIDAIKNAPKEEAIDAIAKPIIDQKGNLTAEAKGVPKSEVVKDTGGGTTLKTGISEQKTVEGDTFTTAQGSKYEYTTDESGITKTTRDKSLHQGHDATDVGKKPESERTIFIDPNDIGAVQDAIYTKGQPKPSDIEIGDNEVTVRNYIGKGDNQVTKEYKIPFTNEPTVGKHPLEFWADGGKHLGNKITERGGKTDGAQIQTPGEAETKTKVIPPVDTRLPTPELQGRLTKLDIDMRAKQLEIGALEQQLVERENAGKPTDAINARLARKYNQYTDLDNERAYLEEGYLTPEDIAKGKVELPAAKITQLRAKAVEKIIKGYEQGVRKGTSATKDTIKRIQGAVSKVISRSGLTPGDKSKLLAKIKNIQTPEQLEKALPDIKAKIAELAEDQNKNYELKRLGKTLKQTDLVKGKKYPVGKFSADIQKTLNEIRSAIQDPEHRARVAAEMDAKIQRGEKFNQEDYIKAAVADYYADIKNKSAAEIAQMTDELQGLMKGGRAENLEKRIQQAERLDAARQDVEDSIQGGKAVATRYESDASSVGKGPWKTIKQFLRTYGHSFDAWDKLWSLIGQDDPGIKKGKTPRTVEILSHNTADKETLRITQEWSKELNDRIHATVSAKNKNALISKLANMNDKRILGNPRWADGTERPLTLTGWDAIKLYMEMKDPGLRAGLEEGNEYTFRDGSGKTVQDVIEAHIGEEGRHLGDALLEHFREFYKPVNEYWRETRGVDLPFNDFYSPARRRVAGAESDMAPFDRIQSGTVPISARTRTKNAYPLAPQNAMLSATNHLHEWAHFMAHEQWAKTVEASIVKNPRARYIIETKYGKGVLGDIDYQYNTLMGRNPRANAMTMMDAALSRASVALVAGKLLSFPRHIMPVIGYLYHVSAGEFTASIMHAITHPKEVVETLNKSPIIRDRFSHLEREFIDVVKSGEARKLVAGKTVTDWVMLPVEKSSALEKYGGAWAVYQKTLEATGDHEQALKAAEDATKELSFGGGLDTRSSFQMKHPVLTKFGTIQFKHMSVMREAMRNAANHGGYSAISKAAKAAVILGVFLPAMDVAMTSRLGPQLAGSGHEPDNTDHEVNAVISSLLGLHLPLIHDVINAALMGSENVMFDHKNKLTEPSTVLGGAARDAQKLTKSMLEAAIDPSVEDFWRVAHYGSRLNYFLPTQFGGELPASALERTLEGLFGIDISEPKRKKSNDPFADSTGASSDPFK